MCLRMTQHRRVPWTRYYRPELLDMKITFLVSKSYKEKPEGQWNKSLSVLTLQMKDRYIA
jgi:hypothetical protein